ncbi:hypothetical protein [Sporosarcina cyprini]|uniref:hypothetical protein n=1 Tax=Sporosarcina cyprini TaxID=2910523 RepID=UPI001EE0FADC|nr:hypothetical protein [Sporosarcina cyprini]MCG3088901.1 hypothetical protein [Sporosarcina cyprini]
MTQFYYVCSKSPLDTGIFGEEKKESRKGHMTYETEVDEASITVKLLDGKGHGHLSYPYQYEVDSNIGDFGTYKPILNELDQKCLNTLLSYIKEAVNRSFVIEFYTAWAGEEDLEPIQVTELALEELTCEALQLKNLEKLRIYRRLGY